MEFVEDYKDLLTREKQEKRTTRTEITYKINYQDYV